MLHVRLSQAFVPAVCLALSCVQSTDAAVKNPVSRAVVERAHHLGGAAIGKAGRRNSLAGFMMPEVLRASELVYAGDFNAISIFNFSGKLLGRIPAPGSSFGDGLAVDRDENLWATGTEPTGERVIYRFKKGALQPNRTLVTGTGNDDFAMGIAIGANETVYAAIPLDLKIEVFTHASTNPTREYSVPPPGPFSLTIDNEGNLLALLAGDQTYASAILEYPHGKGAAVVTPYNIDGLYAFGIVADPVNHVLATVPDVGSPPAVLEFLRNDPFLVAQGGPTTAAFLAMNRQGTHLYYSAAVGEGSAGVLEFPSLKPIRTFSGTDNDSIAVSPAANH